MVSTLSEQSSWMGCGQVARWVSSSSSRNWRNTRSLSASVRRSNSPTLCSFELKKKKKKKKKKEEEEENEEENEENLINETQ